MRVRGGGSRGVQRCGEISARRHMSPRSVRSVAAALAPILQRHPAAQGHGSQLVRCCAIEGIQGPSSKGMRGVIRVDGPKDMAKRRQDAMEQKRRLDELERQERAKAEAGGRGPPAHAQPDISPPANQASPSSTPTPAPRLPSGHVCAEPPSSSARGPPPQPPPPGFYMRGGSQQALALFHSGRLAPLPRLHDSSSRGAMRWNHGAAVYPQQAESAPPLASENGAGAKVLDDIADRPSEPSRATDAVSAVSAPTTPVLPDAAPARPKTHAEVPASTVAHGAPMGDTGIPTHGYGEPAGASELKEQASETADVSSRPEALRDTPRDIITEDVFVVETAEQAEHAVQVLMEFSRTPSAFSVPGRDPLHHPDKTRYFGCDTEVAFIDVKEESPVGHGAVICFSVYGGPDINFNRDPNGPRQDRLWVDCWSEVELQVKEGTALADGEAPVPQPVYQFGKVVLKPEHPILSAFKRFFEDDHVKKVWHNYGFDRHVLSNMGIECAGFGADTLHMARLLDASRSGKKTYGLDSLTADPDIMGKLRPETSRRAVPNAAAPSQLKWRKKTAVEKPKFKVHPAELHLAAPAAAPAAAPTVQAGADVRAKRSMKEIFGRYKPRKDNTPGKLVVIPDIHELHTEAQYREAWIDYSALDAKATWQLREALYRALKMWPWYLDDHLSKVMGINKLRRSEKAKSWQHDSTPTLYEFYQENWVDFGRILTDMEKEGILVDREHLKNAEIQAIADRDRNIEIFRKWAATLVKDAQHMNVSSGAQVRQLFFPEHAGIIGRPRAGDATAVAAEPEAIAPPPEAGAPPGGDEGASAAQPKPQRAAKPKALPEELPSGCRKFKVAKSEAEIEAERAKGIKRPKKYRDIMLHGIWGAGEKGLLTPDELTSTNAAPVSILVLKTLAGKPGAARKALAELVEKDAGAAEARSALNTSPVPILDDELDTLHASDEDVGDDDDAVAHGSGGADGGGDEDQLSDAHTPETVLPQRQKLEEEAKARGLGKLYAALGCIKGKRAGLEACVAVEALCEVNAIDKLLSGFIIPLQRDDISTTDAEGRSRVHCSLNINTETGRLSARRPNLQNQPALEKDRYKVRKAFCSDASRDHTLIVADYGQLELRILAHMAGCKSMLRAFVLGGDFHSRTAYGMYEHIQDAVKAGECYLEWEGSGAPDKPLLKDKFASERRKAKILNFSIAYGKTAHGLAKDFNTTLAEAEDTVAKWYADRSEVRTWQLDTKEWARKDAVSSKVPFVSTLLGRNRPLPDLASNERRRRGHAERAAINTPIQGSAADVAAAAMVAIAKCPELRRLGWKLLMQVHDEVILEGPRGPVTDKHPKGETAEEARKLVVQHMSNPWQEQIREAIARGTRGEVVFRPQEYINDNGELLTGPADPLHPLLVELSTSSDIADTWYEAK